jgi:hypothetical protein
VAASTFDTLRIAQALRDAGFDNGQAEAIVSAIQQSLGENVATKADLAALRDELRADMAELRADIYRALWVQGAGLLVALGALASVAVAISKAIS